MTDPISNLNKLLMLVVGLDEFIYLFIYLLYIYIYMYIYIYVYIYICTHIHVYIYIYVYINIYLYREKYTQIKQYINSILIYINKQFIKYISFTATLKLYSFPLSFFRLYQCTAEQLKFSSSYVSSNQLKRLKFQDFCENIMII